MSDNSKYELPTPSEKLSYKFIMDSLKDRARQNEEHRTEETPPAREVIAEEVRELATAAKEAMAEQPELPEMPEAVSAQPFRDLNLPAEKKYFRIGEVSELIGVEPYVLRYWENEFSIVRPVKSRSGQRVYARKDVESLHYIRHLLHVEKFSIKGAKKKLLESRRQKQVEAKANPGPQRRDTQLKEMVGELKDLIHMIKVDPGLDLA